MCAKTTFVVFLALAAAMAYAQQTGRSEAGTAAAQATHQVVMVPSVRVLGLSSDRRIGAWKPGLVVVSQAQPSRR